MVLQKDVLSVVLEFTMPGPPSSSFPTSSGEVATSRCVNRTWRGAVDDAISQALPIMPSDALGALLIPGKLRSVLLACRYYEGGNIDTAEYDSLVSRAEKCGRQLREAILGGDRDELRDVTASAESSCWQDGREWKPKGASFRAGTGGSDQQSNQGRTRGDSASANCMCHRVALKGILDQLFLHRAFSWCSTLSREETRLVEGCVGSSSLLNAIWSI